MHYGFIINVLFLCLYLVSVICQRAVIDTLYHYLRETTMINGGNFVIQYPKREGNVRKQKVFPQSMPFPCANSTAPEIGRSIKPPTSVHQLRPGDIDVIGAMGDSLIAGNGAMEEFAFGAMIEYRGISWCAGGQGTWRQYLTLPNILKEFNPNLTGYSTGTGEFLSEHSKLNVAFPVSADKDALRQAKILVKKMKSDPKINIQRHWKMITIFFGANDICSAQCFDKDKASPNAHATQLMYALDYLQEKLPRTFVNLIPVLDTSVSLRIKRTMMCRFLHSLFCTCFHHQGGNELETVIAYARNYQRAEEQLVKSGRYDVKEDFTVVLQPFMKVFNAPNDPAHYLDEVIDISFITHDCFHFSQKGHALAANLLWNNLLEPVGRKSMKKPKHVMQKFNCPSQEAPFLFTSRNSKNYLSTGHQ
ncbi:hypothetical protein HHI36_017880 [Cryptolaemus montrouzieri]|uniref:Phospholipase B1, membrane-associated n=1 Tax=Cryptolaemus montrouzieri TaxID=559131 RepID=A0ABD2NNW3_9CUCU